MVIICITTVEFVSYKMYFPLETPCKTHPYYYFIMVIICITTVEFVNYKMYLSYNYSARGKTGTHPTDIIEVL